MSYKASVSNIYELLDEDGGVTPQANVGGGEEKRVPAKKVTPAPAKTQAKQEQQTPKAAVQQQQRAPRQERSIDRRPPREFSSPKAGEGEDQKERRVNREGGERRFERGGRGGFAPRGNKRTFDRRSGTGRGKEDKKGGAGKGNWGTIEDDQKVGEEKPQQQDEKAEPQETQPQGEQVQPAEAETPKVETKEPEEEEDKTRTLDEFFKTKPGVKVDLPKPRQAGEGVSDEWKGFVALKKEEGEVQGGKKEEKKKESKKEVVPVSQVFKVQEEQRQRRERPSYSPRGGRGGKRGGGGSGKAPFVQDEASFPSLSTKA